jgi:hypothetical protein
MPLVYLLSTAPRYDASTGRGSDELRRLQDMASKDRFKVHRLTSDAAQADLILFVDSRLPDLSDVRVHALYRQHAEKCFVVHHGDRIFPFAPGIYTCAERPTHPGWRSRTGSYLTVVENSEIEYSTDYGPAPYLFSFIGRAATSPVRAKLMTLRHPRAMLVDTSPAAANTNSDSRVLTIRRYAEAIRASEFVLCPRGYGSSSYRLFETLKSGRVPVIISDRWVPPKGPDWRNFAVFVPESRVTDIPRLLQSLEHRAREMGRLARCAWEEWFAEDVIFHRSIEWCLQLNDARPFAEKWALWLISLRRLQPGAISRRLRQMMRASGSQWR